MQWHAHAHRFRIGRKFCTYTVPYYSDTKRECRKGIAISWLWMERVNRECSSCPMQQWPSAFYCVRIVDTSSHAVDSAHLEPIRALSCSESILLLSRRSKLIARKRKPVALRRNLHKITHRCLTVQLQLA